MVDNIFGFAERFFGSKWSQNFGRRLNWHGIPNSVPIFDLGLDIISLIRAGWECDLIRFGEKLRSRSWRLNFHNKWWLGWHDQLWDLWKGRYPDGGCGLVSLRYYAKVSSVLHLRDKGVLVAEKRDARVRLLSGIIPGGPFMAWWYISRQVFLALFLWKWAGTPIVEDSGSYSFGLPCSRWR